MSESDIETLRAENERLRQELSHLRGRGSQGFLRSVLKAVPAFIMHAGPDYRIRYINRVQPGLSMDQVVGSELWDYVSDSSLVAAKAAAERALETGETQSYRALSPGPNGGSAHYDCYMSPVPEPDGTHGICLVALDVTDHVAREKELRENRDTLRFAVEATGMGIWSWDLATHEVHWDDRMRELTGHDEPLDLERYIQELVHPDDRDDVIRTSQAGFELGEYRAQIHRIVRPDGEVRWSLPSGRFYKNDEGEVVRMVGGSLDITEQRALEEQLRQARKMEAVGNLTAGVAHNFNNMLMAIIPALDLLRDVVPTSHLDILGDAALASNRAREMIRQLMTFARPAPGTKRAPHAVGQLIARALVICRRTFDRNIVLSEHIAPDLPAVVCNPGQIEQVVMNILVNARDAVNDGGGDAPEIRVDVSHVAPEAAARVPDLSPRGYVRIRIVDDGPGMDPATRGQIFEPFFTTKDVGRGTGLGLATSYAIIREHEGHIRCTSTPDEGSAFDIFLPDSDLRAVEQPEAVTTDSEGRVLLIDDEPAVRRISERLLRSSGFGVQAVSSGSEALGLLREGAEFDVVLLDRSMPERPGAALIPELRALLPAAKILFFTGQDISDHASSEVDGVVFKPTTKDELVAALQRTMAC